MTSVAISPKFQVVIPRAVRQQLKLKAGQRVHVRANEAGQVVIEPELDIMNARGILHLIPGVDITHIENDPEGPEWPGGCDPLPDADWVQNSKRAGLL
jgi:AbrB family looped-hinge helix DNA binding protein